MVKILLSLIICIFLYACAGQQRMVQIETAVPEVDTLDVLFDARADSQITIHSPSGNETLVDSPVTVIPPEPQQPAETIYLPKPPGVQMFMKSGFRVQVMASSSQAAAIQYLEEAKQKLSRAGYVIPDKNLWKVQMGNYLNREDAENFRNQAVAQGFSSAWIVATQVLVPKENNEPVTKILTGNGEPIKFRIQIFAGTNKLGADEIAEKAKDLAGDEIFLVEEDGLWKIRVGDFETREMAERALNNWKNQGYSNAWVVETK